MSAFVSLSGCASSYTWEKPGASMDQMNKDFYECEKDMRQSGYFGGGIVGEINAQKFHERCLIAKGYIKKEKVNCMGDTPEEGCP